MIVGLLFPFLSLIVNIFLASHQQGPTPKMFITTGPFLLLGFLCELLAFIFGIIGWKTIPGKIAAIGVPCTGLSIVPVFMILSFFHVRATSAVALEQKRAKHRAKIEVLAPKQLEYHWQNPLDSMVDIKTQDGVQFDINIDHNNSADGRASLKVTSDSMHKQVIHLFETGPIQVENRMLLYQAKLRSDLERGIAYLEMRCIIPNKGEFFSRGLEQPISGTTNWTTVQTPFRLEEGQMPANVKLNLVIEGTGTVWIDDIKLLSSPLN